MTKLQARINRQIRAAHEIGPSWSLDGAALRAQDIEPRAEVPVKVDDSSLTAALKGLGPSEDIPMEFAAGQQARTRMQIYRAARVLGIRVKLKTQQGPGVFSVKCIGKGEQR
jgi:hypothetical protein